MARTKTRGRKMKLSKSHKRKAKHSQKKIRGGNSDSLFKNYMSNLRNNLNGGTSDVFNGGGYAIDPSNSINNGRDALVQSYSDSAPPLIVENNLLISETDTAICNPSLYGGSKKRKSRKSKKTGKKTKKVRKQKSKSSKKTKRKTNKSGKKNKKQSGGMRAAYPDSLVGPDSNHDGNMINREFGCKQPEWQPSCV